MRLSKFFSAVIILFATLFSCGRSNDKIELIQTNGKYDVLNNYAISGIEFQNLYGKDDILIKFIQDHCQQNEKLVLLFAETSCPACIKVEIDNLTKTMAPSEVILVCATESKRYLTILKRENDFSFPIVQIAGITREISQYLSNRPVYFFQNETPMPYLFLPDKNNNMLTMQYLRAIKMNVSK